MNFVRRPLGPLSVFSLTALLGLTVLGGAAEAQTPTPKTKTDSEINRRFERSGVDVKGFVRRFESEDREVYAKRNEIAKALDLKPGMAVADVGAGTGPFTRLFAEKVGKEGKVYAVDISRDFLKHIAEESKKLGQDQVETILGSQDGTNLKPGSVDLIYICDVYHHFEAPEKMLASIHQALKPGGTFALIEFDRVEGKSSDFVLKHVRASQEEFIQEIEAAGFKLDESRADEAPTFKENFFAKFRRVDKPTAEDEGKGRD